MDRVKLQDEIFEAMLKRAVIDRFDEQMVAMPSDDELKNMHHFSETHKIRMKKLFAKDARRDALRHFVHAGKRVAVVMALAATILFGALMLAPDVRAAVKGTVIIWYEQFTKFFARDAKNVGAETELGVWALDYVPEGYSETSNITSDVFILNEFKNNSGDVMTMTCTKAEGTASVNNEDSVFLPESINGIIYYIFDAESIDDKSNIIWDNDGVRFTITAKINLEELKRVAFSVKKMK